MLEPADHSCGQVICGVDIGPEEGTGSETSTMLTLGGCGWKRLRGQAARMAEAAEQRTAADILEIPQPSRTAGTCKRLARVMTNEAGELFEYATAHGAVTRSKFAGTPAMFKAGQGTSAVIKSPLHTS